MINKSTSFALRYTEKYRDKFKFNSNRAKKNAYLVIVGNSFRTYVRICTRVLLDMIIMVISSCWFTRISPTSPAVDNKLQQENIRAIY